ncbi:hypothetical protein E1298_46260, partial [Actinomadura rubrisoli]
NFPGRTQTMPLAVYLALETDPQAQPQHRLRGLLDDQPLVVLAEPLGGDPVDQGGLLAAFPDRPVTGALGQPEDVLGRGGEVSAAQRADRPPQDVLQRGQPVALDQVAAHGGRVVAAQHHDGFERR